MLWEEAANWVALKSRWLVFWPAASIYYDARRENSRTLQNAEGQDELHRRQADINRLYGCEFADLEDMRWLRWLPRFGEENFLMTFEGGQGVPTPFFAPGAAAARASILNRARQLLGENPPASRSSPFRRKRVRWLPQRRRKRGELRSRHHIE